MNLSISEELQILGARCIDFLSVEALQERLTQARHENRPLRIKFGADPSSPDLHLGHLVVLNKLREFQELGHQIVFIVGDFTGMIGDPSGKSKTRPQLSREEVERNAETYKAQVFQVLDPDRTEIRHNAEWFSPMGFDEVIRLSARVTVAQMLARDDFAKRYAENQPISLVEFLYPLVQAYDSVMVRADVELGGTDQLFNLLLARELQKSFGQAPQVVMTLPLIEGLDGVQKMSKSLGNAIGLTEPAGEMFGKIMSVSDDLMWRYFEHVLCADPVEIAALRALHPREAKDRLATRVVARFHGESEGLAASREFSRVFSNKDLPSDMPELVIDASDLEAGRIGVLTLLTRAGMASSNGEARRLVQQGAVRLNDEAIRDPLARVEPMNGGILKCGKRRFAKLVLS